MREGMVRRMVDTTVPWLLVVLDVNARAYDREGALFEDFDADAHRAVAARRLMHMQDGT